MLSFSDCTVTDSKGHTLFQPAWGMYDMAVGEKIISVYSGTADKEKFDAFPAKSDKVAIELEYKEKDKILFRLYNELREMRDSNSYPSTRLNEIYEQVKDNYKEDWLIRLELYEIARKNSMDVPLQDALRDDQRLLQLPLQGLLPPVSEPDARVCAHLLLLQPFNPPQFGNLPARCKASLLRAYS